MLLQDLKTRGLIYQTSGVENLADHLESGQRTLYCGFDPTAGSLHLGHLLPLLVLRRFQLHSHRPILVIGGATGLIGDPSGRNRERPLNSLEKASEWAQGIQVQASRYLDFSRSKSQAMVVNNLDWTRSVRLIDFLRDTGKHFTLNTMIQKESVRSRLHQDEAGISFTEFSYMLLQSLDYYELAKQYGCSLQIGGSDQWGNITSGIDLVRRKLRLRVHGLTLPLITKADGTKFGKSDGSGTIWLNPKYTSPYQFYQFWVNTADADVSNMLSLFTFLSSEERQTLLTEHQKKPEKRVAQFQLARKMTQLVHGKEGLAAAERITQALFDGRQSLLNSEDFVQLEQDGLPCLELTDTTIPLRSVFAKTGLAKSTSAFKDAMNKQAVSVNGKAVHRFDARIDDFTALHGRWFLLRFGKRKWAMAITSSPEHSTDSRGE